MEIETIEKALSLSIWQLNAIISNQINWILSQLIYLWDTLEISQCHSLLLPKFELLSWFQIWYFRSILSLNNVCHFALSALFIVCGDTYRCIAYSSRPLNANWVWLYTLFVQMWFLLIFNFVLGCFTTVASCFLGFLNQVLPAPLPQGALMKFKFGLIWFSERIQVAAYCFVFPKTPNSLRSIAIGFTALGWVLVLFPEHPFPQPRFPRRLAALTTLITLQEFATWAYVNIIGNRAEHYQRCLWPRGYLASKYHPSKQQFQCR